MIYHGNSPYKINPVRFHFLRFFALHRVNMPVRFFKGSSTIDVMLFWDIFPSPLAMLMYAFFIIVGHEYLCKEEDSLIEFEGSR